MKGFVPARVAAFAAVTLWCNIGVSQRYLCDIKDVGVLSPNEFSSQTSLTHIWQGAVNGVNTDNADRISGLYDLDLYYLLAAREARDYKGDYVLLTVSNQASFGNGVTDSKVGSFFNLNDAAKGDNVLIDKLFVEFTAFERTLLVDIGKIEPADLYDSSAVAHCEKSQFLAEPLVHNLAIPFAAHGLGVNVRYEPADFWYVQAAIGDGQADKRETGLNTTFHDEDYFFGIVELGIKPGILNMPGTYRLTAWYDPQDKEYLDSSGRSKRDDVGLAVSFDQKVNSSTTLFFRYGWADDKVNEIEDFVSFGGQVEGLLAGRDRDIFAAGCVYGVRSPYSRGVDQAREIELLEVYYAIEVNENVRITPNFQFVTHPGGLKRESPATIFGLRCRVKF